MRKNTKNILKKVLIIGSLIFSALGTCSVFDIELKSAQALISHGIYFEIDKNPIERVELKAGKTTLEAQCGEKILLNAEVYPKNARSTVINKSYRILQGKEYATVENGVLSIHSDAMIGGKVEVLAVVDGVESDNTLTFTIVRTPVESIEFVNQETEIQVGGALLFETQVYPENATEKYVTYSIVEGAEYAKISYNGVLSCYYGVNINEDATVTVRATSVSDPSVYCERTLLVCEAVMEVVEVDENLSEVEQQRTYRFNLDKEPYSTIFGEKAVYYDIDVDASIATIDLTGLLHINANAPIGSEITVTLTSSDDIVYEQKFEVVLVYATAFAPVINTEPSLQWNDQDYYLPGDVIQFEIESFQPVNVTDCNKVCVLQVSNEAYAYVEENEIIIRDVEAIKQKNPHFIVTVYSEPNKLAYTYDIYIYIPVESISITQSTTDLREAQIYSLQDLFSYEAFPSNSMPRITGCHIVGVDSAIAEIKDDELIIHDDLPAGIVEVGIYVDMDGIQSEVIYFDVYKPTRSVELTVDNNEPISAKDYAQTVTFYTRVSETASINKPAFRILQGGDYIDTTRDAGMTADGLSMWQLTLKKNLAYYDVLKGIGPILIEAEQDGVVSNAIYLSIHLPNEDLYTAPATIKRGEAYAIEFTHTPYASTTEVEWRIVNEGSVSVNKVSGSPNEFFVPQAVPAGSTIRVQYRSVDTLFYGNNYEWKEVVYTVDKIYDQGVKLVYDNMTLATEGFNVVYGTDSSGVVIGKNSSAPQLWVGRSAEIQLKYRGASLSDYGMSIKKVTTSNKSILTGALLDVNRLQVAMQNVAGNLKASITVLIQDGNETYEVNVGELTSFRPMSGELTFNTVTANKSKMTDLINQDKSEKSFDFTASKGVGDLTFELLSGTKAKIQNGVFSVTSYIASKTHKIRYSYTPVYNGEVQDDHHYSKEATITLKTIKINANGGSGGYSELIALSGMSGIEDTSSISSVRQSKEGHNFAGYGEYINASGKVTKDYHTLSELVASWSVISYTITITENHTKTTVTRLDTNKTVSSGDKVPYGTKLSISVKPANDDYKNATCSHSGTHTVPVGGLTITSSAEKKCVATGTLITLADGSQKAVEDLDGTELLLVWNFHTGQFDVANILFVDAHGDDAYIVTHLYFEDGTVVDMIDEHGFWDVELNQYIYLTTNNAADYIGHYFNKQYVDENGNLAYTSVRLVNVVNEQMVTGAYSPVTYSYLCYYVNGMLSMPGATQELTNYFVVDGETMRYDVDLMQSDIEMYGLFSYEDFADEVPYEIFEAMNGQYLKVSMAKGLMTEEILYRLIATYSKFFEWEEDVQ